jgi:UPF0716 protein FxsA
MVILHFSFNQIKEHMRLIIPLILLAFPIAEIVLLVKLAYLYGWWLLFYLVVIGYLGLQLIKGEKLLMGPKLMQTISSGGNPMKAVLGSARNLVAGVLLLIPGVLSDAIAVVLLIIPMQQTKMPKNNDADVNTKSTQQETYTRKQTEAANDNVIEGEYTHIKEDKDSV